MAISLPSYVPYMFSLFKMDRILPIAMLAVLPAASTVPEPREAQGQQGASRYEKTNATNRSAPLAPIREYIADAHSEHAQCSANEDNRASDLCAQWRAVDEAKRSADWARASFWLTFFGTGAIVLSLVYAARASRAAADAVRMQIATERARLGVGPSTVSGDTANPTVHLDALNRGRSHAIVTAVQWDISKEPVWPRKLTRKGESDTLIRADERSFVEYLSFDNPESWSEIYIMGFVEYESGFDILHRAHFCDRLHLFDAESRVVTSSPYGISVGEVKCLGMPKDT